MNVSSAYTINAVIVITFVCFMLFSLETQRNGLVFIYDMTHSKYLNFDYELSIKILSMLKVIFPITYLLHICNLLLFNVHSQEY